MHQHCESALDEVWSQLPPELLERVLPFLPVSSLCRFRTICKRWNALIAMPEFGALCVSNARKGVVQSAACFVVKLRVISSTTGRSKDVIPTWGIFDPSARRWYNLKSDWVVQGVPLASYDYDVPAMDAGLVCTTVNVFTEEQLLTSTIDNASHPQTLIVANLMGNAVQVLPNPPLARIDLCWLNLKLVVEENSHYKVFLMCVGSFWNERDPCMCVYDSATKQWHNPPNPPVQGVGARVRSVLFRGVWYVLFSSANGVISRLCGYHIGEDVWEDTDVEFWQSSLLDWCELVVSDNRLFLMTQRSVVRVGLRKRRKVCWPLDISEISLGDKLCTTVVHMRELEPRIRFITAKITTFGFDKSILLMCRETGKIIVYHLLTSSWEFLPANPAECLRLETVKPTGSLSRHGKHMSFLRLPNTPWG